MTPTPPARRVHVLTVHHRSADWIEPQARALDRWLPPGSVRWACLDGVEDHRRRFDHVLDIAGSHADRLDAMAALVLERGDDDDLLLFLDGDAFPVAPVDASVLDGFPLAAVRRAENLGDVQPHPCFCLTTVGFWRALGGSWQAGPQWRNAEGRRTTDVGATLWHRLEEGGHAWRELLRSNARDLHPVWFALYGGVVYHHGAGFRPPASRLDLARRDAWRRRSITARVPGLGGTVAEKAERKARSLLAPRHLQLTLARNRRTGVRVRRWVDEGRVVDELMRPPASWRRLPGRIAARTRATRVRTATAAPTPG